MKSEFEALIEDLAALHATRTVRENAARAARHAQRDTVSRATAPRRLMKAAPVDQLAPNFEAIAARQQQIAADLEQTRIEQQKDAIRAHIATLMAAARAGRLDPHSVCVLDVLRGRALSLGLEP